MPTGYMPHKRIVFHAIGGASVMDEMPPMDCLCPACIDRRAADRHATVEAAANITAIESMRGEIRANTDPEFWKWKPVD